MGGSRSLGVYYSGLSSDHPHKWWTILKLALFGVASSVPPLVKSDGCITHSPLEKVILFADVLIVNRAMKNLIFLCHVFLSKS